MTGGKGKIGVAVSDAVMREVLIQAFAARFPGAAVEGPAGGVLVTDDPALCGTEEVPVIRIGEDEFSLPLRLGAMLDRIARHLARSGLQDVSMGPWVLLPAENRLVPRDGQAAAEIHLTEKECRILLLLRGGNVVGRQDMLNEIWGYASGVETHTLETHIYRLRQKIENDPARPRYLLTEESGYRLAV